MMLRSLAACAVLSCLATSAFAAQVDAFLKLDGIKGELTARVIADCKAKGGTIVTRDHKNFCGIPLTSPTTKTGPSSAGH